MYYSLLYYKDSHAMIPSCLQGSLDLGECYGSQGKQKKFAQQKEWGYYGVLGRGLSMSKVKDAGRVLESLWRDGDAGYTEGKSEER